MITVVVNFEVTNFEEWLKIYKKNEKVRNQFNIKNKAFLVSIVNPNEITIVLEVESRKNFRHFFYNDVLAKRDVNQYAFLSPPQVEYYIQQ